MCICVCERLINDLLIAWINAIDTEYILNKLRTVVCMQAEFFIRYV